MWIEIPEAVEEILKQLNSNGFEAYAVGGCVRDTLLGRCPEDWDITTSAKPEQVKAIFGRTIDTGILHGTVTIMIGYAGYEVTTYRIDGDYQDGRHPDSVEFTSNLWEDLKRRDFTINAMAYNHETGIVDAFGGMEDLKSQIIRCVGSPADRFTEDALRLLRAIRFSAQLGFSIEQETLQAIAQIAPNMDHVSKERIQAELTKLLLSHNPGKIALVYETGLGPYISNAFHRIPYSQIHINQELAAKKHLRWAAFLRLFSAQDAVRTLKELKMDNETISKVKTLVQWISVPINPDKTAVRKVMSQMEYELFDDLQELKLSMISELSSREEIMKIQTMAREIRMAGECIRLKDMALTGYDLIQSGMEPGREIGETLKRLFEDVLKYPEHNTKEYLLNHI